jgi:hypothetical protein
MDWKHSDCWRVTDNRSFTVEVKHWEVKLLEPDSGCYDRDGGQRWAVYAYLYPAHPHFKNFDETDRMWQDAACAMPFHCGPSYLRRHVVVRDGKPETVSIQVGADYNHDGDWPYTQDRTQDDAIDVFDDAEELVEWLKNDPAQASV